MRHPARNRLLGLVIVLLTLGLTFAGAPVQAAKAADEILITKNPLVIVIDLSGSMDDQDSKGVKKIDAAKDAIRQILRQRPAETPLGIWTYPGGAGNDSGCSPGGWVKGISPDVESDPTVVDSAIRSLSAGGDTPTGPALQAVVEDLKKKGFNQATIVLISDGLSNCGGSPCGIAQDIVDSNFLLYAPTIGFDISGEGNDELKCISSATNADNFVAEDAEELGKELTKYHGGQLTVEVDSPQSIYSGGNALFVLTIANKGKQDATGLTTTLLFDQSKFSPTVQRRILPALKPGQSVKVDLLVTAQTGFIGEGNWNLLVGAKGEEGVTVSGTIKTIKPGTDINNAGKLLQDLSGPVTVFGDSYSSGEGAGGYLYQPDYSTCHRSLSTYGGVLGGEQTQIYACSGAIMYDVWLEGKQTGQTSYSPQTRQMKQSEITPGLAFLTIGGNDIGFGNIVQQCLLGHCAKKEDQRKALTLAQRQREAMKVTYRRILDSLNSKKLIKNRGGRLAPLVVSPYPKLLPENPRGACGQGILGFAGNKISELILGKKGDFGFSPAEIRFGNQLVAALNHSASWAVEQLANEGYPIAFAGSVTSFPQPNHTMCSSDSWFKKVNLDKGAYRQIKDKVNEWRKGMVKKWISDPLNQLTPEFIKENIPQSVKDEISEIVNERLLDSKTKQELAHPNADGYQAWAQQLALWSQGKESNELYEKIQNPDSYPRKKNPFTGLVGKVISFNIPATHQVTGSAQKDSSEIPDLTKTSLPDRLAVKPGDKLELNVSGYAPNSKVTATLFSSPRTLAYLQTNDSGEISSTITVPEDLPEGKHTLEVRGLDSDFEWVSYRAEVKVSYGITLGSLILGLAAVLLLAGGIFGIRRYRRTKQSEENSSTTENNPVPENDVSTENTSATENTSN